MSNTNIYQLKIKPITSFMREYSMFNISFIDFNIYLYVRERVVAL